MGSRARVTAAACLMVSGLLIGGWTTATASADTGTATNADTTGGGAEEPARPQVAAESGDADDDPDDRTSEKESAGASEGAGDTPDPDLEPLPETVDGEPPQASEGVPVAEEAPEEPRPPCCTDGDEDCEPGWPWPWPWPWPDDPDDPPKSDDGYGEGRPEGVPSIRPLPGGIIRPGVEPPLVEPEDPGVLDTVPGVAVGNNPQAPISVPLLVTAATGGGAPAGPAGAGAGGMPRPIVESTPPRQLSPAPVGRDFAVPASPAYRAGYGEYLRGAGISQVAALAVPGLAGILVLTGVGGYVGYRQAKAGQGVRASGIARFMN